MRARTILLIVSGLVMFVLGAGASLAEPVTEDDASFESQMSDVRIDQGPGSPSLVTFRGEANYEGPEGETAEPMVTETQRLQPEQLDGVGEEDPYQYTFRTTPTVNGVHGSTVQPGSGYAHHAWFYGGLAEGSYVNDGERMESLVGVSAPSPLFPPREVTDGGELSWEPVENHTYELQTREWDPEDEAWETARSTATGFAAVLRVDGGGLVADQDVVSPELRIPLGGDFVGAIHTLRPTAIAGIDYEISSGTVDEEDGESYRLQVTVKEGSQWPQSGDEGASGTWKLVIRGVAATYPQTSRQPASADASSQGAIRVDLGALPPGTTGLVETSTGTQQALPQASKLSYESTPGETIRILEHEPWPQPIQRIDADSGLAEEERVEPGGSSMRVASSCGSEYVSAAHAGVQEQGELRFDLANRGTEAENVCIRGTPVGSFALPMVKVDGFIYWPKLIETEPQVRAYHYGTSQGFGTQFVLTFHGQAGPIEYTARLPLDADENGGGFLLSITDFHATDGDRHEVRFVWAMDADAGEDEVFQAYGQAPVLTETILPNPGQVANLAIGSHEHVIASEETGVQHTFDGRAPMDVVVYRTSTLLPQPALPPPVFHPIPEVWATPPEPLVGADVSFAVPHMMEGAYMGWMTDRGNLVDRGFAELPLGGGALVNAGFLIAQAYTGQLGYTGYHVVEGV